MHDEGPISSLQRSVRCRRTSKLSVKDKQSSSGLMKARRTDLSVVICASQSAQHRTCDAGGKVLAGRSTQGCRATVLHRCFVSG